MSAFLKAVHCLALCFALGGPLFWTCIWRVLDTPEVHSLLEKLESRADALGLSFRRREVYTKLMDVTALATSLAMNFAYTGQLTG